MTVTLAAARPRVRVRGSPPLQAPLRPPRRPACAHVPVAVARGRPLHLSQEGGPAPRGKLQLPALAAGPAPSALAARPGVGAAGGWPRLRGGACAGAEPGGGGDLSRANEGRGH